MDIQLLLQNNLLLISLLGLFSIILSSLIMSGLFTLVIVLMLSYFRTYLVILIFTINILSKFLLIINNKNKYRLNNILVNFVYGSVLLI